MKNINILSILVSKEISQKKSKYLLFLFVFFSGLIIGTICSIMTGSTEQIQDYVNTFLSSYSLHGTEKNHVFFLSILNYGKFLFFLWVSGWYLWLFPLCFLQVFSKGFRIGFSIASFVHCYAFKGVLFSLITLFPQNFIFLPTMLFFAVYQTHFLSERKLLLSGKNNTESKRQCYQKNILFLALFVLIILICASLEGYFIPSLLQLFSKLYQ